MKNMVHQTPEAAVFGDDSRTIKTSMQKNEARMTEKEKKKGFLSLTIMKIITLSKLCISRQMHASIYIMSKQRDDQSC